MRHRPFRLGGCVGCPLTMTVRNVVSGTRIGRVRDDFQPWFAKCVECCCMGKCSHSVDVASAGSPDGYERKYTIRASMCCCGRVNNCGAAWCCRPDPAVYDILDTDGNIVANIQKVYAPGPAACCRVVCKFDNYVMSFPPHSTPDERSLLLAALFQVDYQLFERNTSTK